jgi:hypothetical protein
MRKKLVSVVVVVCAVAILGGALSRRLTGQVLLPRVGGVYFVRFERPGTTETASMLASFNDFGQVVTSRVAPTSVVTSFCNENLNAVLDGSFGEYDIRLDGTVRFFVLRLMSTRVLTQEIVM